MKFFIIVIASFLVACAPASKDLSGSIAGPIPAVPIPEKAVCQIYDACTYRGDGFVSQPVYNCVENTLKANEHPEIPVSYFNGESCLTYREDFHSQQSACGPMNQFICDTQMQGPGPLAIPTLNL